MLVIIYEFVFLNIIKFIKKELLYNEIYMLN